MQPIDPTVGNKHKFVVHHFVDFVQGIDDEAHRVVTQRPSVKPTMAQTSDGGNCGTRVRSFDRRSMQSGPPIRGHVREAQRRQAVRPRVLIIVFSMHCVDQLQTDVFARAQAVVRKEQGDDAAENQGVGALAIGDVHQVQDYEARSLKNGLLSKGCNGRLHAASARMSVNGRLTHWPDIRCTLRQHRCSVSSRTRCTEPPRHFW